MPRSCLAVIFVPFFFNRRTSKYTQRGIAIVSGSAQPQDFRSASSPERCEIPLPPLATQQAIVAEIEAEQALVAANRELIARFEKKIQATLARVWGEDVCRGGSVITCP